MTNLDELQSYRPLLFSIAYRMLGTASDAEDVVQDAPDPPTAYVTSDRVSPVA
jgi:hypothetical protein